VLGNPVQVVKKGQRLLLGHALRIFREGLRGDADGLHFVAGQFESCLGAAQHLERVQANEGGNRADCGLALSRGGSGRERHQEQPQENGVETVGKKVRGTAAVAKHFALLFIFVHQK
jgi:hypothetical protein